MKHKTLSACIGIIILWIISTCSLTLSSKSGTPAPSAPIPTATAHPAPTTLPKSIDPLGIFGDSDVFSVPLYQVVSQYNAKRKEIPNIYTIDRLSIFGEELYLKIRVKDGKVIQVSQAIPFNYFRNAYSECYQQMLQTFGNPTTYYERDEYFDLHVIDKFKNAALVVWEFEDYSVVLGDVPQTYNGHGMYISIYSDKFYEEDSDEWNDAFLIGKRATTSSNVDYFDPTGIMTDSELFSAQAETIIEKYGASPAYEGMVYTSEHSDERTYKFIAENLSVLGHPATLEMSYDSYTMRITNLEYTIDLLGRTPRQIQSVYDKLGEALFTAYETDKTKKNPKVKLKNGYDNGRFWDITIAHEAAGGIGFRRFKGSRKDIFDKPYSYNEIDFSMFVD